MSVILMFTDGDDELLKIAMRDVDTKINRPITDDELEISKCLLLRITGSSTADATDRSTTTGEDAMLLTYLISRMY